MNEIIYLEPDEEITSVIDRLRKAAASSLSLVIPRGGTLAQSIVNLKLLKKSAQGLDKEISLVSTDRISRNLASQIGLTVYSKVSEAEKAKPRHIAAPAGDVAEIPTADDSMGFRVNHYYRKKDEIDDEVMAELKASSEKEEKIDKIEEEPQEHKESEKKPVAPMTREPIKHVREDKHSHEEASHSHSERTRHTNLKGSRKPLFILLGCVSVLILCLSYIFVPYAKVSVRLQAEDFEEIKEVSIDKNAQAIDSANLVVPGEIISLEKEELKTFDSTGKKDVGTKAKGKINVYNTLDTKTHVVAAGSKFTSNGKVFVSLTDVTVPAATPKLENGQLGIDPGVSPEIQIEAEKPGEEYNVASGDFIISGIATGIYGRSNAAMTGGTTKQIKIVTEEDLTNAEKTAKEDLTNAAKTEIIDRAKEGQKSIIESEIKSEIISTEANKKALEEADKFTFIIKLKIYTLGYATSDLNLAVLESINAQIGNDQMIVNPERAEYSNEILQSSVETGLMKIKTNFKGKIGKKMTETEINAKIRNKNDADAVGIIKAVDGIEDAEVKVWPSFLNRTPVLNNRIKVIFDYSD